MLLFHFNGDGIVRTEDEAARAHHMRTYGTDDNVFCIRFHDRSAGRHGIPGRTGWRGKNDTVAGKGNDSVSVAQRRNLDAVTVAVHDDIVQRLIAADFNTVPIEGDIQFHPAAEFILPSRRLEHVFILIRFKICHKSLCAKINAEQGNRLRMYIPGRMKNRAVTPDDNDQGAGGCNFSNRCKRDILRQDLIPTVRKDRTVTGFKSMLIQK